MASLFSKKTAATEANRRAPPGSSAPAAAVLAGLGDDWGGEAGRGGLSRIGHAHAVLILGSTTMYSRSASNEPIAVATPTTTVQASSTG